MTQEEKPKGRGREVAGKVIGAVTGGVVSGGKAVGTHMGARRTIPTWVLYLILGLFVVVGVYAGVQQFRAWRLARVAKAAKIRIDELKADNKTIEYKTTRKLGKKLVGMKDKEIKQLDTKLQTLEQRKKELKAKAGRMTAKQLRDAFNSEDIR